MPLLDAETRKQVKAQLEDISHPVTLHVFTQELECAYCRETRQLAEELAAILPEKVKLETHNFALDRAAVSTYKIDKIPAIAVVGKQDTAFAFTAFRADTSSPLFCWRSRCWAPEIPVSRRLRVPSSAL